MPDFFRGHMFDTVHSVSQHTWATPTSLSKLCGGQMIRGNGFEAPERERSGKGAQIIFEWIAAIHVFCMVIYTVLWAAGLAILMIAQYDFEQTVWPIVGASVAIWMLVFYALPMLGMLYGWAIFTGMAAALKLLRITANAQLESLQRMARASVMTPSGPGVKSPPPLPLD